MFDRQSVGSLQQLPAVSGRLTTEPVRAHAAQAKPSLDVVNQTIYAGQGRVQLSPKAFAVLDYLRQRPAQLVTKDELLTAVWPRVCVGDAVLKNKIRELRRALSDCSREPRFIETVHRRGYRFIGELPAPSRGAVIDEPPAAPRPAVTGGGQLPPPARPLAGRQAFIAQLDDCWGEALRSRRRTVFIKGDAGVGKSALIDAWLARVNDPTALWARSQSLWSTEAAGEYLPVLDALNQLCQSNDAVVALLSRHAPGWLRQLPWLHDGDRSGAEPVPGSAGLLLEIASFFEALATQSPLLLVFEDLHLSDPATLNLLGYLARRTAPARLCIVGTLRPLPTADHLPCRLHHELHGKAQCQTLALDFLSPAAVADFLRLRCGDDEVGEVAAELHRYTDGHPQLLSEVVDQLLSSDALTRGADGWRLVDAVDSLPLTAVDQFAFALNSRAQRLASADRTVLEAASLFTNPVTAGAVAALLHQDVIAVENSCEALVQQLWLRRVAGPSTGQTGERYWFTYSLYRRFLFASLPAARRRRWQRRLGEHGADGGRIDVLSHLYPVAAAAR